MSTQTPEKSYGGLFEKVREYYVERTALFGLIQWEEVARVEKIDNDLILHIRTTKMPTRIYVNNKPYELVPLQPSSKEQ